MFLKESVSENSVKKLAIFSGGWGNAHTSSNRIDDSIDKNNPDLA